MAIEKIIVVEDNASVRKFLEDLLRSRRYDVASAGTVSDAQELLARDTFDLMFVDLRLPDGDGTDLLKALQARPQKPVVVMITGFGSVESAVTCMRHGAFDYLIKPFSVDQIEFTLKKAEEFTQLVRVNHYLSHEEAADSGLELLGRSKRLEELRQLIRKVARTQATVLISGESGTGKELVARALYRQSPRGDSPFIKVNCAAIPENLIESEFFGHEKGAFTGAMTKREGRFELAHGGTILLDEISEISPQVQAKLLRVLQERELERVGGNRTIKVDVRVLATTNRRLEESVERKEFRQDLFFRLNVVPITVPPLRERREDIPLLAEQFVRRFARKHGVRVGTIPPTCLTALQEHYWPGNVRELQNVIERAVILCAEGGELEMSHLGFARASTPVFMIAPSPVPVDLVEAAASVRGTPGTVGAFESSATPIPAAVSSIASAPGVASVGVSSLSPVPSEENGDILSLAELEKRQILLALERCKGNRTHAAIKLGINVRTLRNKLHEYCGGNSSDAEPSSQD